MSRTIAYLAGTFPSRSETFVYREVRALRARGWRVNATSLYPPEEPGLAGFEDLEEGLLTVYGRGMGQVLGVACREMVSHPIRSFRTLRLALRDAAAPGEALSVGGRAKLIGQAVAGLALARMLRARGVEHVHCHFAHSPATVGMYAAAQLGIGFSFTGHANDIFQRRALLKRKLERAGFAACISHWHRAMYSSIVPGRERAYVVVRCGVDTGAWRPVGREESGGGDVLKVLAVCRLVEKKGIDTLIRAAAEASAAGLDCELSIAGDGPDAGRLRRIARETGVEGRVRWLGAVENEQVRRLLMETDVFALPCRTDARSDRDGIPVVLMEAMACGVPVVSGDLPAIRELIEDGESGLLVDGTDAAGLAEALRRLAGDEALRCRVAAGGRRRVEEEFSLDLNVGRLERALVHVMSSEVEK